MTRFRHLLVAASLLAVVGAGACTGDSGSGDTLDTAAVETTDSSGNASADVDARADGADDTEPKTTADAGDTAADTIDTADGASVDSVTVAPAGDLDWVEEPGIVYARGLSHEGGFNAEEAEPMDLVGDLYRPQGIEGVRPALLIVHGGGFLFGSRTQSELVEFAEFFASRGWVVFSIDYRLADDYGTVPDAWVAMIEERDVDPARTRVGKAIYPAVRDAKAAVRWLEANAGDYDISPDHIAVMGGSAGAHIAVALGVTDPRDFGDELTFRHDPTLDSANLNREGDVAAILDFWGGTAAVDGVHEAFDGPERWDADDAPILIVHGTADDIVPIEEGEAIRDAYRDTGAPHRFVPLEGAGHGPWDETVDGQNLRQLAHGFLSNQMGIEEETE